MAEQKNGAWGLDSIVGQLCILWIALFSKKSRNLYLFKTKAFLADIIPSRFLQTGPCECRETQPWRHSLYSLSFTESRILSETGCAPRECLWESRSFQAFASSPAVGWVFPVLNGVPEAGSSRLQKATLPHLHQCSAPQGCFGLISQDFSDTNIKVHSWI